MKQEGLIILLCRNNIELSRDCLKSLRAQTAQCEILVIDNASTDGTKQWLRAERGIRVMSYEEPVSVAQAWNDALRWGWSHDYDEALVINNDTWLLPETYETLSCWAAADDGRTTGMVTCVSRRERSELVYEKPFNHSPRPDFSAYLIQKWAWERIGGFDENCIGAFYEDNCAHAEMWLHGITAESISLPFLHHGSQTIKTADWEDRKRIMACADHNRQYFFDKYGRWPGTEGYDELFSRERFGMYESVTCRAQPLQVG